MATSVLGLKTFAASDPVDYNEVNDNYVKIDNGVKTALQGRAAQNCFVNSDWEYAVNQRGQTSWTRNGVYCIDMWKTESANDAASISYTKGSGITLTPTSTNYAGIIQKFENSDRMTGNVYTVAVCVGGTWKCVTLTIGSETEGKTMSNGLRIYSPSGSYIIIRNPAGKSAITIQRVALYEGSYTADTLPEYQPKGYAAELAECRRYYKVIDVNVAPWLFEGTNIRRYYVGYEPMRTAPTVDVSGLKEYNVWTDLGSVLNPYNSKNNRCLLSATLETTSTKLYIGGSIALSADL